MDEFTKDMAKQLMEDALSRMETSLNRGIACGTAGAFYMVGLIDQKEWEGYLARIPSEARHA